MKYVLGFLLFPNGYLTKNVLQKNLKINEYLLKNKYECFDTKLKRCSVQTHTDSTRIVLVLVDTKSPAARPLFLIFGKVKK
ncbi:unnamed protein product [Acanthoscelides obtectus]|uniref:Uncharacterized protein n=1 Tax=Acanthoscelides obtectus TaxID=200917 RepID=A0A9P0P981_ACAOB|nr:unnamed protein product [Acanthoscelides obtectus]CAK1638632.1 hypothetical protein AOBTE_LOCUS10716 [Acanthoscelides obtectus]